MNKKGLIILAFIIGILVIGGIGFYFYNQFQNNNENNNKYEAERTSSDSKENRE